MERKLVISVLLNQIQLGIVEDGRLAEYYLERDSHDRLVANIYKGRVDNILPGMGAAFIDIGIGRNAFFFLGDLPSQKKEQGLRVGETLLVQVTKEATRTKGPRVTGEISLPGRYLVFMPEQNHVGVSRQIEDDEERERLRAIGEEIRPQNVGLIIRTVAEGCSKEELEEDLKSLSNKWIRIEKYSRVKGSSSLIYQDYDLVHRVLRDFYEPNITEIIVDSEDLKEQVESELDLFGVVDSNVVKLHEGKVSIFTQYGLNRDLQRARENQVWLKCGGYLVFNQTEALLSIDVNTGKYVGKDDLQKTVLKTNLEAATEIAYQLRLRNVGGIVIIDFIDMDEEANREAVLAKLKESLDTDKTHTNILGFTRLGLVELTRKKNKKLLSHMLEVICPHCHGSGRIVSDETIALAIASEVNSLSLEDDVDAILIRSHSAIAAQIIGPSASNLESLEHRTGKTIFVRGDDALQRQEYRIISGEIKELERKAFPVQLGEQLTVQISEKHAKHKTSGLVRIDGFAIECLDCAKLVGKTVTIQITKIHRTSGVARLVSID